MVSPVRVRVPPLPVLSGFFLFKLQICGFPRAAFGSYFGQFRSFPGEVAVKLSPGHLLAIPRKALSCVAAHGIHSFFRCILFRVDPRLLFYLCMPQRPPGFRIRYEAATHHLGRGS
jgi:hypothetical protein